MYPEIHLGSGLVLPTYLVVLSLVYSGLIIYLPVYSKAHFRSPVIALNGAMIIMIAGLVGGRLFHVFFENLNFYRFHWERVFEFWLGGFVFYGGFFTAFAAGIFYLRWIKEPLFPWLDFFAPLLALGYGLGRISCLMAGCCYGQYCELPWAVNHRHPTQAYASVIELLFLPILFSLQKKVAASKVPRSGLVFGAWALWHALGRIFMESLRDDDRGPTIVGLSISTWLSFVLLVIGFWMVFRLRHSSLSNRRGTDKVF